MPRSRLDLHRLLSVAALVAIACHPRDEPVLPSHTSGNPPADEPRCAALDEADESASARASASVFALKVIDPHSAREALERVIRAHHAEVQFCYDDARRAGDPPAEGEVDVRLLVTASGDSERVCVAFNDTGSASLGACLAAAVERWSFPAPALGPTTLTHRFRSRSN